MTSAAPRHSIAIVGAGFAGLSSAVLLARAGHRVTLLDKFETPASVGAGILVQPSGLAAMRVLGIEQEMLEHGARVDRLLGKAWGFWPVVNVRYDRWQKGSFGLGLHRGVLFDALWRQAKAAGVQAVTGEHVRDLAALQSKHDLVVIADGCRSSLRVQTGLACSDRVYPWGAVWAVLRDPEDECGSTLAQWFRGARQMLGIMPTGLSPAGHNVVSLFWSVRADRLEALREAGVDAFKASVRKLNPRCEPLLDQIRSMDDLTWARYHDVVMPSYNTDRCVVIGDAAHATSPQLGQGTNLALLDAVALAQCLEQNVPMAQALDNYTAVRRQHLHFYGEASRWLTPLFQSDQWMLPFLRTLFMNAGTSAPFLGTLTRQTLVGVRQGWKSAEPLAMPGLPAVASVKAPSAAAPAAGRDAQAY
ncbi:NAD(P)/FAD-dependent oxidoreductase [Caenimonas sp. SL110]|uniref:FAD-dependent oxidoreductase n=1 Tax=Caenimonas sp. SL110 TaxID=1450524 RepID=UPI00069EEF73|nr:NAD(P)/FAD-dependent oxidoreductase [Caenimonas sp. SL110]